MIASTSSHLCATCEYWMGPREVMRVPTSVECTSCARGKCYSIKGPNRARDMACSSHCSDYKTWRYLTDR